ncbi:hypothetical protein D3C76_1200900 [compost metagenome]|uniref:Uncharacterized protein n=1 Tax=Pseudomonas jinjuensis TaxID=198616 RepID=A0A1H0MSP3_9PSED|nr:hypothetical protein [Pseudomonas jinjuensis]SDO83374.1 hypothetical protein SAMN05216193_116115 [Pseudomonas jinjuensis]
MPSNDRNAELDIRWNQLCQEAGVDPVARLAARESILADARALDATLYRPNEEDEDAEEDELGDARVLIAGPFQPPAEWTAEDRDAYYDGAAPERFFSAFIECEAEPASREFFLAEPGDYVAVMARVDKVEMYYLYDYQETGQGRACVLLREDDELE